MAKQKELPGMPKITDLGKQAKEYTNILNNIEDLKIRLDDIRIELIGLFKKEKRTTIAVDGITLTYAHLEKDQIKVNRPE